MDNQVLRITSNIIHKLYDNENIFKLLKYNTPNALELPNLSDEEKQVLIKNKDMKRIHKTSFSMELIDDVRSELRIYKAFMPNVNYSKLIICFDIVVHKSIWDLDDDLERGDFILFELKKSLHNEEISGMGKLQFKSPIKPMVFGKDFYGYRLEAYTRIEW